MAEELNGRSLYDLMLELDRLEEIREDLLELGLRSLDEIEARIDELNRIIDEADDELDEE
ncbi:hypothetical protein [Sphaerobacter thermophilus]|uniref:Uncharacterized protein n=1 Tax=Sphaerobacter thermophilus (strain ATCC 49802 / DSM 20745 / KCCM 41009 / NCIMB 13125 / S 6022) TaxID=479434 RepID=D1C7M9_SPHTD|nr:hypothetical protein [Sphaerobacter thermophilus]ACZ37862.1 hypothetical protein Sthe_0423 [Sphaerobacter thermophilus DSM 20745]PZN67680.1 MAG: hypothetical protein DIU58_02465 [Sphaerobacter thermophilus]